MKLFNTTKKVIVNQNDENGNVIAMEVEKDTLWGKIVKHPVISGVVAVAGAAAVTLVITLLSSNSKEDSEDYYDDTDTPFSFNELLDAESTDETAE